MLYWQIMSKFDTIATAATFADLNRVHLSQLLSGKGNFLTMDRKTITRLLNLLGMSDVTAWETFNIPLEHRDHWTTTRAAPLGFVRRPEGMHDLVLDAPLQVIVPAGETITINEAGPPGGLMVSRLGANLFVTPAETIPKGARVLGRLMIGMDSVFGPAPSGPE